MRRWMVLAWSCAVLALVPIALACSEDEPLPESPTQVIGATARPAPTATPRVPEARTGIAEVDALIDALLVEPARERRQAVRPLFGFVQVSCSFASQLGSDNALCRPGEGEGQLVDAFEFDSCERQVLRSDEIDQVVILLASATMHTVYRAPPAMADSADYAAIVYDLAGDERRAAEVLLKDGRVLSYVYSCTSTPEEFAEALGLTDVVYEAEEG